MQYFSMYCSFHSFFNSNKIPNPCWWEASLQDDSATTILHCRVGVSWGMGSVRFAPHIVLWVLAKKLYLGLISTQNLLPHAFWQTHDFMLSRGTLSSGFFLATLPYRPVLYSGLDMVDWCTITHDSQPDQWSFNNGIFIQKMWLQL